MPQPRPRLIGRLGDIAAQLRGEPGDQHRVFLAGLIAGQVLGPPRPRGDHRLHAHERHRTVRSQLPQHPPPVPGRLARHRHPRPPSRRGAASGPVQRRPKIPGAAPERPPCDDPRIVGHHDHLLAAGQVDPGDRVRHSHQGAKPLQARIAITVTSRHATTVTHERPPAAWDTKPESASGGRSDVTNRHAERLSMPHMARQASMTWPRCQIDNTWANIRLSPPAAGRSHWTGPRLASDYGDRHHAELQEEARRMLAEPPIGTSTWLFAGWSLPGHNGQSVGPRAGAQGSPVCLRGNLMPAQAGSLLALRLHDLPSRRLAAGRSPCCGWRPGRPRPTPAR